MKISTIIFVLAFCAVGSVHLVAFVFLCVVLATPPYSFKLLQEKPQSLQLSYGKEILSKYHLCRIGNENKYLSREEIEQIMFLEGL